MWRGGRYRWFGGALGSHGESGRGRAARGRRIPALPLEGVGAGAAAVAHAPATIAEDGRPEVGAAEQGVGGRGEALTTPACAAPAAMPARCSRRPCVCPRSRTRRGSRRRLASAWRTSSPASLERARGRLSRRSARAARRTAASKAGCCSSPAQQAAAASHNAGARRGRAARRVPCAGAVRCGAVPCGGVRRRGVARRVACGVARRAACACAS